MFRSFAVSVALSLASVGGFAQAPTLASRVNALKEQTEDVYVDSVKIQPNVIYSEDKGDNSGIDTVFELSSRLSANFNHLLSLELIIESANCPNNRALVKSLQKNLVKYMAAMLDNDLRPINGLIVSTHSIKLLSIYHRLDDIMKAERQLLDDIRFNQ